MGAKIRNRLTPRQRLTRGLTYTALGPVDVTRGVVGLGMHSAQTGASNLRQRYREGRLARELAAAQETLAQELSAALGALPCQAGTPPACGGEVVSGLPEALQEARRSGRRSKRPWVIAAFAAVALAGGAVAFSVIRRSSRPEPSPRPPSVDVQPRP